MPQTYLDEKKSLLAALERADAHLRRNARVAALLETYDPACPFELAELAMPPAGDDVAWGVYERLFDRAFLEFGYHEVLDENCIEGISYEPLEELLVATGCIGVADLSLFDGSVGTARMAHEADYDESAPIDDGRFGTFLELVQTGMLDGSPRMRLGAQDIERVCGLVFSYDASDGAHDDDVVAFQRVQPSARTRASSLLLLEGPGGQASCYGSASVSIGRHFDFVLHGRSVLFRTLSSLETLFRFTGISARCARAYADTLDGIVADLSKLGERIDASRAVATKLLKLQREGCPVAELAPGELAARTSRIAYYSSRVRFDAVGRVLLETDADVASLLALLQDTLLVSPLTELRYETRAKTPLADEAAQA